MKLSILLFITLVLISQTQSFKKQQLNEQPVIGILMQESSYSDEGYPPDKYSYIAASYVKYAEMAGAQVVPIYYDADQTYYEKMMNQISGLLIPGGAAEFTKDTKLGQTSYYLYNYAKKLNDEGIYFPIWGTCNGFEILVTMTTDFGDVLSGIEGEDNVNHSLNITQKGNLYKNMPDQLFKEIQTQKLSFFNHDFSLLMSTWNNNLKLRNFYELLGTNTNVDGVEFVSVIEGKKYPFFAVQFHPEKSVFEWKVNSNHSLPAVEQAQYYADYFVQLSRSSPNSFRSQDELNKEVIYNYSPIQIQSSSFEQVYMFKNFSSNNNDNKQQPKSGFLTKE